MSDARLIEDWAIIWQSELAALAVDREAVAAWTEAGQMWLGIAAAMGAGLQGAGIGPGDDAASATPTGSRPAARPAAAGTASGVGGDEGRARKHIRDLTGD